EVIVTLPGISYVVAFSQDGKDLLVSTSDRTPLWWNLSANTNRPIPGRNMGGVISADLSPDRRLAVLGHEDGTIQLLDLDSGQDLRVWRGHQGAVRSVKFSPRGDKLVSGGRDRSVTVWDVATQKNLG